MAKLFRRVVNVSDDILDKQSRLKTWTNRFKKIARRKYLLPDPVPLTSPASLLSCTTSSCATTSSPPASHITVDNTNETKEPSFSETTAEVDPEFGFSMRRMRGDFGLYHDKNTPPRLYLDTSRQSDAFSPFRPFSPTFLLPSLDTSEASLSRHSPRYFSTGSFDRYRSISASLAAAAPPLPPAAVATATASSSNLRTWRYASTDSRLGVVTRVTSSKWYV
uniref:Uncharacterized protein n=1 Tax=Talaromyces marneffei PM1 TaxID=1077442 RepID=A0A093VH77_TALMA